MKMKVTRDVLDWKGKPSVESFGFEIPDGDFDASKIVKSVVKTGKFDPSKLNGVKIGRCGIDTISKAFSEGLKFSPYSKGTTKMVASEFFPLGFQYIEYERGKSRTGWIKTDTDITEKIGKEARA